LTRLLYTSLCHFANRHSLLNGPIQTDVPDVTTNSRSQIGSITVEIAEMFIAEIVLLRQCLSRISE
jgi:hypothetical protein